METPAATPAPAPATPAAPAAPSSPTSYALDTEGSLIRVPVDHLAAAQAQGVIPVTDEEAAKIDQANKYGDRPIAAAAAAFARGATLHASDGIARTVFHVPGATLKGLDEQNPEVSKPFEIGGMLTTAALSDGASLEAELGAGGVKAAAALTPSALVPRLGKFVADAAAARLGEGAVARVATGALRAGTESAIYGAADAYGEHVIENKPLTGELLAAHVGPSVLLGLGTGAAFESALGLAAKAVPPALERASAGLEKLGAKLEALTPEGKAGRVVTALDSANGAVTKGVAEAERVKGDLIENLLQQPAQPVVGAAFGPLRQAVESVEGDGAYSRLARKAVGTLEEEVGAAKTAHEQFQAFQRFVDTTVPLAKPAGNAARVAELEPLQQMHAAAKDFLQDERVWGKAATVQREWAAHVEGLQDAQAAVGRDFLKKGTADAGAVKKLVAAAGRGEEEGVNATAGLKDFVARSKGLMDWAREASADLPTGRRNIAQAAPVLDELAASHAAAVKGATPGVLDALGHIEHLVPHQLGVTIAAARHLSHKAEVIAQVAKKSASLLDMVSEHVADLVAGTRSKAAAAPGALSSTSWGTEPARGESKAAAAARHVEDLARLSANPAMAVKRAQASTGSLSRAMPDTTSQLQLTGARAGSYLTAAAPKTYGTALPGSPKPQPSEAELARYERVHEAVAQPLGVIVAAQAGRLTGDHVRAVATVYPAIYAHICQTTLTKVAEATEPIPLATQVQLSILVGKPVSPMVRMLGRFQTPLSPSPAESQPGATVRPVALGASTRISRSNP